jgi:hypothetical protein
VTGDTVLFGAMATRFTTAHRTERQDHLATAPTRPTSTTLGSTRPRGPALDRAGLPSDHHHGAGARLCMRSDCERATADTACCVLAQMSLFATTTEPVLADGNLSPAIPSPAADEITLSPKSPTPAPCISPRPSTSTTETELSPDAWAEVEAVDATEEAEDNRTDGAAADSTGDDADAEVARLRSENEALTSQVATLHTLLQEHAELAETAAAEISPTLRKPHAATTQTWWGAATSTFRTVQSDEAVRATEKQAVKTVADAARSAAETATEGAVDGALAALGHPELAPAADRLVDVNANAIEDEVVAYVDELIDATATSAAGTPAASEDSVKSDTVEVGAGSIAEPTPTDDLPAMASAASSPLLPEWSRLVGRPTTHAGWFAVGAVASLAGLYAAKHYGQPHAASALAALREKIPACPSLPRIGGGAKSAASGAATCVHTNADDSLSLAPVLVSLGRKAASHVPGEGMPEMIQAGLGESGHNF